MKRKLVLLFLLIFFVLSLSSCEKFCLHSEMSYETVAPTCTTQGYTIYSCTSCDYSVNSDFVKALPHATEDITIAASCTKAGYVAVVCADCNYSYNKDYTQPNNHSIKTRVTEPTCDEAGFTEYFCINCEFSYKADFISAEVHDYKSEIILPTCTEEGYTKLNCCDCDSEILTEYTSAQGHDYIKTKYYVTSLSDGYTEHTCSRCDYKATSDPILKSDVYTGARVESNDILAHGIDVSVNNGALDWATLKAEGVDFAILRAGSNYRKDGKPFADETFEDNYKNAKKYGIDVGAYVYIAADSTEDILEVVNDLLPLLDGKKFEYPIYFDMEEEFIKPLGKKLITEMCVTFITELQKNGYFAALYTNEDWLVNCFETDKVSELFDIWYARWSYTEDPDWNPSVYGSNTGLWQYTDKGTLDGHSHPFDLNYSYKDYPEIMRKYRLNGY